MRTGVLVVMAAITLWKIRRSAALVLAIGAILEGVLVVLAYSVR